MTLTRATSPVTGTGGGISFGNLNWAVPGGAIRSTITNLIEKDEAPTEAEMVFSTSAELPTGIMLGKCAQTGKVFTLKIAPEAALSTSECLKIMLMVASYDIVGQAGFSAYEYVKANNLERHFIIQEK